MKNMVLLNSSVPFLPGVDHQAAASSLAARVTLTAIGHRLGAHGDDLCSGRPAVSVRSLQPGGDACGVWLRGRCDAKDVVPYWVFQIVGAALAALAANCLAGDGSGPLA